MDGISDFAHVSSAVALERSALCEIPYESLGKLSGELPSLQRHFMQLMSREIANDQQLISLLGKNSAEERIAALILSISSRNVRRKFSATEFRLPMSRTDIANYLGLTIETVSRILSKMGKQNIIELNNKELTILDMESLKDLAGLD
jgi:CRP/FNR family transcriptional regulator